MKKLLSISLMVCLLFSMSSFTPIRPGIPATKEAKRAFSFPITGTTFGTPGAGQPATTIAYTINGSGTTPSSITFSTVGGTTIGTYMFSLDTPGNYLAAGMRTQTSIVAVYFHISNACFPGYCVEFIGGL